MKKFICILLILTFQLDFAQNTFPFPENNNVGIGTVNPISKLTISGSLTINGGLNNTISRPLVAATTLANGEIRGYSNAGNGADDGFLRLSAGGGTNPIKSFIDLSGYSTIPDMMGNIVFGTYGAERMRIVSNGNVGIGTTSPFGKLDVVGSKTSTYTSSLNSPTYDFLRIANIHGAGGSDQYSALALSVSGNTGANNAYVNLAVIQPVAGNSNSEFALAVRQPSGVMNEVIRAKSDGKIGIGTSNPISKLTVAGDIHSREVRVSVDAGADFVFEHNYNLPSLDAVTKYIKENKHLPEIASADEMKKEGINLSEMNIKLLQKIEELTLYVIEQSKEIKALKKENESFKTLLEKFSKIENHLKNKK
ncbi:hypothetical protein SAMN02927916_1277 [Flavobacterium anhuiense]|uniref:Uncharacterized protein n=1 Tax=Flavobacterium anhuiense TaxID=459526 RepID=A0ABY0LGG8_9FLAO|nr:hypothetical protein [Flavobacterium anhuiense]SCY14966.1 hypothetical protein SAMN02927916_1277 [Flavobacterium anhuiense]